MRRAYADALSAYEIDGGDLIPEYGCEDCGHVLSAPGVCDDCQEKLNEFVANTVGTADPRR